MALRLLSSTTAVMVSPMVSGMRFTKCMVRSFSFWYRSPSPFHLQCLKSLCHPPGHRLLRKRESYPEPTGRSLHLLFERAVLHRPGSLKSKLIVAYKTICLSSRRTSQSPVSLLASFLERSFAQIKRLRKHFHRWSAHFLLL